MKRLIALFLIAGAGSVLFATTSSAQPKRQQPDPKLSKDDKIKKGLNLDRPDLYVAGIADLTKPNKNAVPLSNLMFVIVGNKGKTAATNVRVDIHFWKLTKVAGKTQGKIYHTRTMTIDSLRPGQLRTLHPYNHATTPVCWSVKIDPGKGIAENNEGNNATARMWATYPDADLRAYSYDSAP